MINKKAFQYFISEIKIIKPQNENLKNNNFFKK